jgi:hypothetical protein
MSEHLALGLFVLVPCAFVIALGKFVRYRRLRQLPSTWRQLAVGNGLVLALLLSVLFLSGEIYFRFIFDSTDAFNLSNVSTRWFNRYWQTNSFGFRDDISYSFALTPSKRRVSFVGDSFTAGQGIKEIDKRFPNLIRRAHPDWEIHVLAHPGFDTGFEGALLKRIITKKNYQVDTVVLAYCLNDISDMMPEWNQVATRFNSDGTNRVWLLQNSYLLDLVCSRWKITHSEHIEDYDISVAEAYSGPLWRQQQERLIAIRDLIQDNGGHLCVVTFPFFNTLGPEYKYRSVHEQLDQFWRSLNVPHLDLLPVYKNVPAKRLTVNSFDAHPNEYANSLAAVAIDKFLSGQMDRK